MSPTDKTVSPLTFVNPVRSTDNFYTYMPNCLFDLSYLKEQLPEDSDDESAGDNPAVPRHTEDPVLLAALQEVEDYVRTTFWCNINGWRACHAALALAKRGLNVLPAFIMLGAGGVGLSLLTDLIAGSLGESLHKFFDPFVFYDDEELRKTIDLLVGGIVFSGQERPQGTNKKMRLHLWKMLHRGRHPGAAPVCYTYPHDPPVRMGTTGGELAHRLRKCHREGAGVDHAAVVCDKSVCSLFR